MKGSRAIFPKNLAVPIPTSLARFFLFGFFMLLSSPCRNLAIHTEGWPNSEYSHLSLHPGEHAHQVRGRSDVLCGNCDPVPIVLCGTFKAAWAFTFDIVNLAGNSINRRGQKLI